MNVENDLVDMASELAAELTESFRKNKVDPRIAILATALFAHEAANVLRGIMGQPERTAAENLHQIGLVVDYLQAEPEVVSMNEIDPNAPADIEGNPV